MKSIGSEPEVIATKNDRCGEGPLWDWRTKSLFWNDVTGQVVHQMDQATGDVNTTQTTPQPSGMALLAGGGLIIAGANGVHTLRDGKTAEVMNGIAGAAAIFNDILATPAGKIYAGTYFWGPDSMEKTGALYLIDLAKKSATMVDEGIELSNGIGLSPDGKTLYYSDSTVRRVFAYDVDEGTGKLSRKRTFVRLGDDEGIPDGLTVDSDGFVWVAQWYGEQVVRYDPSGAVNRRVPLPVKQVSSVAFGGDDLDILFITTAGEFWDSKYVPHGFVKDPAKVGGSLYAMRPGVRGRREHEVKI